VADAMIEAEQSLVTMSHCAAAQEQTHTWSNHPLGGPIRQYCFCLWYHAYDPCQKYQRV